MRNVYISGSRYSDVCVSAVTSEQADKATDCNILDLTSQAEVVPKLCDDS